MTDNTINARIIADSMSPVGKRITTLELRYPRFILAELNTHRVLSRSSASSRAIPVATFIEQVKNKPAMPVHWGKNQPGMQAKEEEVDTDWAKAWWIGASKSAIKIAEMGVESNLHKQITNRVLEPWQTMVTLVTATEWDNFFHLRIANDAQPEIRDLAIKMRECLILSSPVENNDWHLPYISDDEKKELSINFLKKISVARCCRVSYQKHGEQSSIDKDIERYDALASSGHWSPFEHVAIAMDNPEIRSGNFKGWHQLRNIEQGVPPIITSNLDYKRHLCR